MSDYCRKTVESTVRYVMSLAQKHYPNSEFILNVVKHLWRMPEYQGPATIGHVIGVDIKIDDKLYPIIVYCDLIDQWHDDTMPNIGFASASKYGGVRGTTQSSYDLSNEESIISKIGDRIFNAEREVMLKKLSNTITDADIISMNIKSIHPACKVSDFCHRLYINTYDGKIHNSREFRFTNLNNDSFHCTM